jgi:hypothetical protein
MRSVFVKNEILRDLTDLDRVRAFRTLRDFEAQRVTFAKAVERNSYELVRVEKEIFFLTLDFDEPETLVGESGDCSCLHTAMRKYVLGKLSKAVGWSGSSILLLWISSELMRQR